MITMSIPSCSSLKNHTQFQAKMGSNTIPSKVTLAYNYGLYKGKPSGCLSYIMIQTLRACLHGGGGPQIGEVTCGGSPHLSCKLDYIKMRDHMDRQVTPPKRVTSPTWGPPPPCACKQAPRRELVLTLVHWTNELLKHYAPSKTM